METLGEPEAQMAGFVAWQDAEESLTIYGRMFAEEPPFPWISPGVRCRITLDLGAT